MAAVLAALLFAAACGGGHDGGGSGEHGASAGEAGGEESAAQLTKSETYDELRAGSRLVIAYDEAANSFRGEVTNVSSATLSRVRVEVHLSSGAELGPTTPLDLAPGQSASVTLEAGTRAFETWSAHAEVGGADGGEHASDRADGEGHGAEGDGD